MPLRLLLQTKALPPIAAPEIAWVALFYLAVCAGIAVWAVRRTRNAKDYFVAGRGVGLWALAIAAMASALSGFGFIGGPGLVYTLGLGAVFIVLPASMNRAERKLLSSSTKLNPSLSPRSEAASSVCVLPPEVSVPATFW